MLILLPYRISNLRRDGALRKQFCELFLASCPRAMPEERADPSGCVESYREGKKIQVKRLGFFHYDIGTASFG